MSHPLRPSGASVRVVKTFESAPDCEIQAWLMRAAPAHVSLQPTMLGPLSYDLPLCNPHIPASAFLDLMVTYRQLWAAASPRPFVSREEYQEYVVSRPRPMALTAAADNIWFKAQERLEEFYAQIKDLPIEQRAFTHGDSILSNAVWTSGGVRLIDFSPRPTPGEREIDFAKLRFSALGFDISVPQRRRELRAAIEVARKELEPNTRLERYYLVSHVIRVMAKEPPETINRQRFFEGALNHASQM